VAASSAARGEIIAVMFARSIRSRVVCSAMTSLSERRPRRLALRPWNSTRRLK
jgi:hypothetical protein